MRMGSSLGCVKQQREVGGASAPPLSPKKRFRFRRKRRSRRGRQQGVAGGTGDGVQFAAEQDEAAQEELAPRKEFAEVVTRPTRLKYPDSPTAIVETQHERSWPEPNSPGTSAVAGDLANWPSALPLKGSPGCTDCHPLEGLETTEKARPSKQGDCAAELSMGNITPGGGRVCRVREGVQGVLQRPRILRTVPLEQSGEEPSRAYADIKSSPDTAHHGVVHIREVAGKLCVVRTVYPSDFGSLAWSDTGVEVRAEPPAPHREMGGVLRVNVSEEQEEGAGLKPETHLIGEISRQMVKASLVHHGQEEEWEAKELTLGGSEPTHLDPQSSGYASDFPLTSPDTAGGTQNDWGESSMAESPLSPSEEPSHLSSQISEIYVSGESGDLTAKEKLLLWSQQATEGYPGLRCTNFSSSWSDGRMFNALLHHYRPDLIDMETVERQSNRENLEQAFEIAESLGVTRLLDAEDVDVPSPDEKSVITYVSSIYDAFPKIPEGGEGIAAHEVDKSWAEYQSRFSSLLQWTKQHTALMADKSFPQNPVELKVWMEFGRIKLPQGLHPNDLEEEWGKLILEMLEREKALRPAVERLELLLQMANKIQNTALACEEKLTLAKNTLQADVALLEDGQQVRSEQELGVYLQDCEDLVKQLQLDLQILKDEKYYQVEQLSFRVSCLQEELVSLRLQCSSVYRKGHFSRGGLSGDQGGPLQARAGLSLALGAQTLLGAAGAVGALLRRPLTRSQLVAMSSSEDEGSLRFIYELLGWVEETQSTISPNFRSSYSETLAKLEHQYCKLLEQSSWRLRCLESLRAFVSRCTAELIWLNEREEEELAFDWSDGNTNVAAKRELYADMRSELEEKQEVMRNLQETADRLCQENHPAKQTVEVRPPGGVLGSSRENLRFTPTHSSSWFVRFKPRTRAYSAALQTQWQWVRQLCICVEQHLKDNTAYFQFMSDARECESYLRQLQDTIKRQYTCDRNSRLGKLEDLLQDSMEEKEQLIEYRSTVASLVGRAKTVVQLRPRSADSTLPTTATPIRAICDYRQIEVRDAPLPSAVPLCVTLAPFPRPRLLPNGSAALGSVGCALRCMVSNTNTSHACGNVTDSQLSHRSRYGGHLGLDRTPYLTKSLVCAPSPHSSAKPHASRLFFHHITISKGEECVLEDNSQRTKWKVISPNGNEAMVPSVCFTVPPPNKEAMEMASRMEQLYQNVMSLWHQLHVNMKSVVSWHYLLKDIRTVSSWSLDTVRSQTVEDRRQALDHLDAHLSDFLTDSRESIIFTAAERRELEGEVQNCHAHCNALLVSMETVEKDESVSRSYLSELQTIKQHLEEAEQRLTRGIQALPSSGMSCDAVDNAIHIAEAERLQQDLGGLRSNLGDVSRRCVGFFEEKPTSSSVPVLRSELGLAVEQMDRVHALSSVYLHKLKTVDMLMRSSQVAESLVKKYESRLSEEDIVPADTSAIKTLRDQLAVSPPQGDAEVKGTPWRWQAELDDQQHVFQALAAEVQQARETGAQLSQLYRDRSPELERHQERASQLAERWGGVRRQMETRRAELEVLGSVLQQYREGHAALVHWIEETTAKQENAQPGQTDSRVLSEQLAQQTKLLKEMGQVDIYHIWAAGCTAIEGHCLALVAEIEKNQAKLDECQTFSRQYCAAVKDYELQLMTYRAFVESTQKSPVKRRRMHSSSDAITQEFMDLRTRYTALVTLTTQHVKYISDALRRLEEEEKEVEEERQARVSQVSDLLCWVKGLQERAGTPRGAKTVVPKSAESSLAAQQAIGEQLAAKKEEVAEAIRSTQVFLLSKQASKLSAEERSHVAAQLDELKDTYSQLCQSSAAQQQQLEEQLAREEQLKVAKGEGLTEGGCLSAGWEWEVGRSAPTGPGRLPVSVLPARYWDMVFVGVSAPYPSNPTRMEKHGRHRLQSVQGEQASGSWSGRMLDSNTELVALSAQTAEPSACPCVCASGSPCAKQVAIAGVIDLGTVETFPVFHAAQRGLIDQETCHVLLEAQLVMGGLIVPGSFETFSVQDGLARGLIDSNAAQLLSELEAALHKVDQLQPRERPLVPVAVAMEKGLIREDVGLRILELQISAGGVQESSRQERLSLETAGEKGLLTPRVYNKLRSRSQRRELIDPNTAEKLSLSELQQHCITNPESGQSLLPVRQQPGGAVCLRSGRKVGIFRAVQEGLIDREVTVRLLEAQLFAGGIADPRSGHRLTVEEAVRHGLMDQDLACAVLTRQLRTGGLLDPVSGERLGVDEAIRRDLLAPRMALLVLESLWVFMGLLWPESGELLPLAEALQQGVISGELVRRILNQRHSVGALYLPETSHVVPLNRSEEVLESRVVEVLRETRIPDVLPSMIQSDSPTLNRLSWGSASSSPLSSSPPSSPQGLTFNSAFLEHAGPGEQAQERLLFHLMTHSYVDAHSGQRLVLLEPELAQLASATSSVSEEGANLEMEPETHIGDESHSDQLTADKQEPKVTISFLKQGDAEILATQEESSKSSMFLKDVLSKKGETDTNSQPLATTEMEHVKTEDGDKAELDTSSRSLGKLHVQDEERKEKDKKMVVDTSVKHLVLEEKDQVVASPQMGILVSDLLQEEYSEQTQAVELVEEGLSEKDELKTANIALQVQKLGDSETKKAVTEYSSQAQRKLQQAVTDRDLRDPSTRPGGSREGGVSTKQSEEDAELQRLVGELQEGGLMTESGERLLLDEALACGALQGHTAVKLMERAGLFGGFLDVRACEALSVEDVVQEGLLDESLMRSVLKSEKTLAGIVDMGRGKLYSVQDAARVGLLDPETAARLLEAQVVSGGVVDLCRGKKVSVTLAYNLGLIEEGQRKSSAALEKSCRGKSSDSDVARIKVALQLQMDGILDPSTRQPVTMVKALQKGLLGQEEAQELLSQQLAEGGIMHHGSGVRLKVADALQRDLVDKGMAEELEKLERECQIGEFSRSDPKTALLQASTGAVLNRGSGIRLTLTEAVFQDLLDDSIAERAMSSPGVTRGIIDPKSARIVPYSELVNQSKIDIETGQRFLEVKLFGGIKDERTGQVMTLPQALEARLVDPVPALRLLQSQINSGGVVDITSGERLPLGEAVRRGLVGEDMAKIIAAKQIKGELGKGILIPKGHVEELKISGDELSKDIMEDEESLMVLKKNQQKEETEETISALVLEQMDSMDTGTVETVDPQKGELEKSSVKKVPPTAFEKEALLMKAKESILRKVFERGVSEKQAAEELEALLKGAWRKKGVQISKDDQQGDEQSAESQMEETGVHGRSWEEELVSVESQSLAAFTEHLQREGDGEQDAGCVSRREEIQLGRKMSGLQEPGQLSPAVTRVEVKDSPAQRKELKDSDVMSHIQADESSTQGPEGRVDTDQNIHVDTGAEGHQKVSVDFGDEGEREKVCQGENETWSISAGEAALDRMAESQPGPHATESPEGPPSVVGQALVSVSLDSDSQVPDTVPVRPSPEGTQSEEYAESEDTGDSQLLKSSESELSQPEETESDMGESEVEDVAEDEERDEDGETRESQEGEETSTAKGSKPSLVRQECLERDQRMVALLSMVRHIEVRLKQQHQQSSSSPSVTVLNDFIHQAEDLDAELCDLEVKVNHEVDAAGQLLELRSQGVPSQLLLALEKDRRSLSRGYAAAKQASQSMLQGLHAQRDARKEALGTRLRSLTGHMDELLSWLESHGTETQEQESGVDRSPVELAKQLQLCEELQGAFSARSGDIAAVASSVQALVSECAQDLLPEQSKRILGQLQHLQGSFHQAAGSTQARAKALSAQQQWEAEKERRRVEEEERLRAREREMVQQQRSECSRKLEGLTMWLAGSAGLLANQKPGVESGDISLLQERQRGLKEVQQDLQNREDGVMETMRKVEEFLSEQGDRLSPEERASLQGTLSRVREQYSSLTDMAQSSLAQLDSAISTTVQQNTQRAELLQLQAQQAQLLQVSQAAQSLLKQPASNVTEEEKQRLGETLEQLQEQHRRRLQGCQERLRRAETLGDELAKFLQEHGQLGAWLELSERQLRSLGEGEMDAQGLRQRLEEHRKLAEDVICHKADLRFVSISGQKVLDSVQGAREQDGSVDPALQETRRLVGERMQDVTQRYAGLHSKSSELGTRLTGLLDRYQQYQEELCSLASWLLAQEQNQSPAGSSGDQTDAKTLQSALHSVQLLQGEVAERSVQLERAKRTGRELADMQESPALRPSDILDAADALDSRFGALSESVSQRAERLQSALAQSVSAQEALSALQSWLDGLAVESAPVQPTAQAVKETLAQNQKLRQELLSRQASVDAMQESVSKLLQTADATTASGLQGALQDFGRRYSAAQAAQAETEAELRTLLPRLESHERLRSDLRNFVQSQEKALSPGGQPDRTVEDYRQTVAEVRLELNQEGGQLQAFCELGKDLSQCRTLANSQNILDSIKEVSEEFSRLESRITERTGAIQSCGQQLAHFRFLSGALLRWLQTVQEQLPSEEPSLSTDGLSRRVEQLKELQSEWEAQGSRVQELNQTGAELEAAIIKITSPQSKTGVVQINGAGSSSSVNGIHTCQDLTEIQVALGDVGSGYEHLGADLQARLERQRVALELRQRARHQAEELAQWLSERERSVSAGPVASPSRPEVVRTQAQENKALLSELAQHSGKVEEIKDLLQQLIAENPDSSEAETWRKKLRDIDCRWQSANEKAAQRQCELETCADRLGSFAAAAAQLAPWLQEKELMMSVLGPLSIDPNMLNTQKQQVQIMLREFETRRPQFDQLTEAAQGILSPGRESTPDQHEVQEQQETISRRWDDLTARLSQRSELIDRAQGASERYQVQLRELSASLAALGERLDAQASLSTRPEALRHQLQETGEVRAELEQRRGELSLAEELCREL
ncbi:microtubule-actin cross-linking factor 1-like, partial [Scleropages formosus]